MYNTVMLQRICLRITLHATNVGSWSGQVSLSEFTECQCKGLKADAVLALWVVSKSEGGVHVHSITIERFVTLEGSKRGVCSFIRPLQQLRYDCYWIDDGFAWVRRVTEDVGLESTSGLSAALNKEETEWWIERAPATRDFAGAAFTIYSLIPGLCSHLAYLNIEWMVSRQQNHAVDGWTIGTQLEHCKYG